MRPPLLIAATLLASCAAVPPSPQASDADACPIAGSSDWAAWINAMPGPNARPTLIVTGKVTTPTGGYTIGWGDVRVMESHPVQVVAELRPVPPAGGATQAVMTQDVRGQWPMAAPVGSVTVRCGNQTLATISPVETVH